MIKLQNVQTLDGQHQDIILPSTEERSIDAHHLTVFPGLIDPHVHFRTPGMTHKEDWQTAAKAALCGGYTTVFDMPNTIPPTISATLLREKKALIDAELKVCGIPLRYYLYLGADKQHLNEITTIGNSVIGIKVFMGCSTGNLVIDDDASLDTVFKLAAAHHLIVAVHAEDEARIHTRKKQYNNTSHYHEHSLIRDVEVATIAVAKAIALTRQYGTRLYILHVSTSEEIALIKQAKADGLPVYAETTPHHLFLDDSAYTTLQGKAVVNPPLRANSHRDTLLAAINDGTIDTIGSDHAPHLLTEKEQPYGACPSGMPGIETTLPLLITAYHADLISLDKIMDLTYTRPQQIFNLPTNNDKILVDMNTSKPVTPANLKTKCRWSAFAGQSLQGWPVYAVINNQLFDLRHL